MPKITIVIVLVARDKDEDGFISLWPMKTVLLLDTHGMWNGERDDKEPIITFLDPKDFKRLHGYTPIKGTAKLVKLTVTRFD